jgi:hypothetical protein
MDAAAVVAFVLVAYLLGLVAVWFASFSDRRWLNKRLREVCGEGV